MHPAKLLLLATVLTAVSLPTAAASASVLGLSAPVYGDFELWSWGGLFVALSIAGFIVLIGGGAGRKIFEKVPLVGAWLVGGGGTLAVVALLVASAINPNGLLYDVANDDGSAGPAAAAVAAPAPSFATALYETTSDVTVSAADYSSKAAKDPTARFYRPGVSEKAAFEGSATAEYSVTLSSGSGAKNGIQSQQYGCTWDIGYELSGYYEQIHPNVNVCVAKNALGNNDISLPTEHIKNVGTLSHTIVTTTLTCSAGSQCSYSLRVINSEADSYVMAPATKFHTAVNATLDSVDPGQMCEIQEKDSTQYVVFTGDQSEMGPNGTVTCALKITRTAGSADGSFKWTTDDLWGKYLSAGSSGWNTNSNVNGATATSATTVSFA